MVARMMFETDLFYMLLRTQKLLDFATGGRIERAN